MVRSTDFQKYIKKYFFQYQLYDFFLFSIFLPIFLLFFDVFLSHCWIWNLRVVIYFPVEYWIKFLFSSFSHSLEFFFNACKYCFHRVLSLSLFLSLSSLSLPLPYPLYSSLKIKKRKMRGQSDLIQCCAVQFSAVQYGIVCPVSTI